MTKKTAAWTAITAAAGLAIAGGLLLWAHSYTASQVTTQLTAQKITFPPAGSAELKALPAGDATAMTRYAGLEMSTGTQARVYADNFIAVHLTKIGGGKTYSQLSAEAIAKPKDTALAAQVDTVFKGTTLRSMLLNAYGWWQLGQIALWGAVAAFAGAGVLLVLAGVLFTAGGSGGSRHAHP